MTNSRIIKNISDKQLYDLYIVKGLSRKEMASTLNIGYNTVKKLLSERNIVKPKEQMKLERERKKIETCLKKYGVKYVKQSSIVKQHAIDNSLKKYGVKHPQQLESVKNKVKQTCLEKYGVEYYTQTSEMIAKTYKTWIDKYGTDTPQQLDIIKNKAKQTCLEKYGVDNAAKAEEIREKIYQTRKKNNSLNISQLEEQAYQLLLTKFPVEDIERQYKSELYPFRCDFYIKSLDLYIEYNGGQYHYKEPYNKNNLEHIERLNKLEKEYQEKGSSVYSSMIRTWVESDPLKRETAKKNSLNFLEFWSIKEVKNWLNQLN